MWSAPDGASIDGAIDDAPLRPLVRRPPVWIAAHGPVLLRHAGRHADGVIAAWSTPHEIAARIAIATDAAGIAGRPAPAAALYTFCLIAPSAAERAAFVAAQATRLGTSPDRFLRWLGTTGLVGTADEVLDRLGDYAAAGVTDVILALPERVPPRPSRRSPPRWRPPRRWRRSPSVWVSAPGRTSSSCWSDSTATPAGATGSRRYCHKCI